MSDQKELQEQLDQVAKDIITANANVKKALDKKQSQSVVDHFMAEVAGLRRREDGLRATLNLVLQKGTFACVLFC